MAQMVPAQVTSQMEARILKQHYENVSRNPDESVRYSTLDKGIASKPADAIYG